MIAAWLVAPVMGRQIEIDPASLMTTPIVLMSGSRHVSQGTGFFFASTTADGKADTVFLVTNYHVVTGHAPLSTQARMGDRIWFVMHQDPSDLTRVRPIELPLYDARGEPIWVASENHPAADIVLVPLPTRTYAGIVPLVFTEAHTRADIKIRPTSGATLLGYPFGFYDQKHFLPVWKTGHVASEPAVDFEGRPAFLVDVSAFPGMSGSPVLAVANGVYETEDGTLRSGRLWRLLGVFSKMPVAGERDTNLQLGYVWKAALIADLARSYRPRPPTHQTNTPRARGRASPRERSGDRRGPRE
ncbi:MAG TPA: serine protease [Vicinamibacterales bacterium]|nr:serine protease [Vicinamibacterales bacterium]